jgi:hypothetical protein
MMNFWNNWKKLDLWGRAIVLAAVAIQLFALGVLQSERQRGDVFYIMENQVYTAAMIHGLAGAGSKREIANDVGDHFAKIKLFSEWEKSNWNKQIAMTNGIFLFLFFSGGLLSLRARSLELKEK